MTPFATATELLADLRAGRITSSELTEDVHRPHREARHLPERGRPTDSAAHCGRWGSVPMRVSMARLVTPKWRVVPETTVLFAVTRGSV